MSLKDSFAPEDWARVVAAPMLAGISITAASPGGLVGAFQESAAVAGALRSVKSQADAAPLVEEIASAYETSEGRGMAQKAVKALISGKSPAEAVTAGVGELGAIAALVASKAPDAAPAFREWLKEVARRVAEAGTEGGFLGFGGEKVSEAEREALGRIGAALA